MALYTSMLPQILQYAKTHPRNFPPESETLGATVPAKNIHLKYDYHIKLARTQIQTSETVVPQGEEEDFTMFLADAWTFWAFWDYNELAHFLGPLAPRFVEVTNKRMPERFQPLPTQGEAVDQAAAQAPPNGPVDEQSSSPDAGECLVRTENTDKVRYEIDPKRIQDLLELGVLRKVEQDGKK